MSASRQADMQEHQALGMLNSESGGCCIADAFSAAVVHYPVN